MADATGLAALAELSNVASCQMGVRRGTALLESRGYLAEAELRSKAPRSTPIPKEKVFSLRGMLRL